MRRVKYKFSDQTPMDLTPTALVNPPGILQLPAELLQQIYGYLPLNAKALLTLTCKTLLNRLGNATWTDPSITGRWSIGHQADIFDRVFFLSTLCRDLEEWTYCATCKVLHPLFPGPMELKLETGTLSQKSCVLDHGIVDWFPGRYVLAWEHVKIAMDGVLSHGTEGWQHYKVAEDGTLGKKGFKHLEAAYEVKKEGILGSTTQNVVFNASVVGMNVVFKHEHRFTGAELQAAGVLDFPLRVCPHLITAPPAPKWRDSSGKISPLLAFAVNAAFPKSRQIDNVLARKDFWYPAITEQNQMENTDSDYWWCRICATKFRVRMEGDVLVVTVWHDFGPLESSARTNFGKLVRKVQASFHWERNCEFAANVPLRGRVNFVCE